MSMVQTMVGIVSKQVTRMTIGSTKDESCAEIRGVPPVSDSLKPVATVYQFSGHKFRFDGLIFSLVTSINSALKFLQIGTKFDTMKSVIIK